MAKIKCSICSYQFNIWYAGHSPAHILIWFLAFGQGSEVYLTLTTGCLGIALQPSAAHLSHKWNTISLCHYILVCMSYRSISLLSLHRVSTVIMLLVWLYFVFGFSSYVVCYVVCVSVFQCFRSEMKLFGGPYGARSECDEGHCQ